MNSNLSSVFDDLQPAIVWRHFATLCTLPRPSKREERVRAHLLAWAAQHGIDSQVDGAGNLILRKPASAGRESAPAVVLQAHLDMVCQANADTPHDFMRDPIVPTLADGWLRAESTTLGADNGLGVALILAAMEDAQCEHGPLEALLTVDEESGMGGARGLAAGTLRGRLLINLDSEEWGRFCLGCAGGVDAQAVRVGRPESVPAGHVGLRIDLRGLRGGHSGMNIHEGRGNAIKSLVRVLQAMARRWPLRLAELHGGTARNALPREAHAVLTLPAEAAADLAAMLSDWQTRLRAELAGVDDALSLSSSPAAVSRIMGALDQAAWLASLHAAPQGVRRMSVAMPGVVELSDNLGIVALQPDGGSCSFMVRSLIDSAGEELAQEIVSLFALSGTPVEVSGQYPGWAPNPHSALLASCRSVYHELYDAEPMTEVIHAGLECGILGGTYPDMDMISFGPTIHGAHAPGEAAEVATVANCWDFLRAVLASLARS